MIISYVVYGKLIGWTNSTYSYSRIADRTTVYLSPANQYISLQSQYRWHPNNAKGLVEMEQRTCTMVRHGSTVRNGRKSNSSYISRWDRRVRGRWDRPPIDHCSVYRSRRLAAAPPLATPRSACARGTWIRSCPWSRYGTLSKNASRGCRAAAAAQTRWNNGRRAAAARSLPDEICNRNCVLSVEFKSENGNFAPRTEYGGTHWGKNLKLSGINIT